MYRVDRRNPASILPQFSTSQATAHPSVHMANPYASEIGATYFPRRKDIDILSTRACAKHDNQSSPIQVCSSRQNAPEEEEEEGVGHVADPSRPHYGVLFATNGIRKSADRVMRKTTWESIFTMTYLPEAMKRAPTPSMNFSRR